MSRKMLCFVPVVAAVAGVLALAACGSSGSSITEPAPPEPSPPAATAPATPPSVETETTSTVTTEETTTEEEVPTPDTVKVRIENGEPVGGAQTIEVNQGDTVRIRVQVDAPQELHLHGYEIEKEAEPGTPAVFKFTADLEGIFDLESHLTDAKLVKIVVNP